jgi:hypothetical protein
MCKKFCGVTKSAARQRNEATNIRCEIRNLYKRWMERHDGKFMTKYRKKEELKLWMFSAREEVCPEL